jgi:hypothetical protein
MAMKNYDQQLSSPAKRRPINALYLKEKMEINQIVWPFAIQRSMLNIACTQTALRATET